MPVISLEGFDTQQAPMYAVEDVVKVCAKYPTEELSLVINLMSFEGFPDLKKGSSITKVSRAK